MLPSLCPPLITDNVPREPDTRSIASGGHWGVGAEGPGRRVKPVGLETRGAVFREWGRWTLGPLRSDFGGDVYTGTCARVRDVGRLLA